LLNEDIRNGNGRTVKSRYVTENRVDHLAEKIDAVYWIMKDDTLPPVLRINEPALAAAFGATLATKRSSAENLMAGVDVEKLVIEPFANPFRCYSLREDYQDFYDLFSNKEAVCYILNTGFFNEKKVTPRDTLSSIEQIVNEKANFVNFGLITEMSYLPLENHPVPFDDDGYRTRLLKRMHDRLEYIELQTIAKDGYNSLPTEATQVIKDLILKLNR
jgi:phosphoenolpyruvate carboxykinase (ATP)